MFWCDSHHYMPTVAPSASHKDSTSGWEMSDPRKFPGLFLWLLDPGPFLTLDQGTNYRCTSHPPHGPWLHQFLRPSQTCFGLCLPCFFFRDNFALVIHLFLDLTGIRAWHITDRYQSLTATFQKWELGSRAHCFPFPSSSTCNWSLCQSMKRRHHWDCEWILNERKIVTENNFCLFPQTLCYKESNIWISIP